MHKWDILYIGGSYMCTAITFKTKDSYFGRTLDNPYSYEEQVTITPRNYSLKFRKRESIHNHFAFIGMAHLTKEYPLYYDGCNEKGLAIAALNFVGNAFFPKSEVGKENICQFEFIPYILATCKSIEEVLERLQNLLIIDEPFSKEFPTAELHYFISDAKRCITVEPQGDGLKIYDNPIGVLANNPPFPNQLFHLNIFMGLSNTNPNNTFSNQIDLKPYSKGMGAIGLPGDLSSPSRFVRASFVKMNSVSKKDELSSVSQFFHILASVDQQRGCCKTEEGAYEVTIYTSCMNLSKGFYYYTSYDNHQITRVSLFEEDLEGHLLVSYSLRLQEQIFIQN